MNSPRLTVSGLLWGVAGVACVFAALRFASQVCTNIIATVTFLLLMTGVAGAWLAKGLERAFWRGFALFGMTYIVLVNWDWIGGQFGHDLTGGLSDAAELVFPVPPPPPAPTLPPGTRPPVYLPLSAREIRERHIGNFVQIGRCILTLVCALIGGLIAQRFATRAAARNEP